MRQPYFALILLITSPRKGGRREDARERRLGPAMRAHCLLRKQPKPAGSSLSTFPASWVPGVSSKQHRERQGTSRETCDPDQFKGHGRGSLLQNQGSFSQGKAGDLTRTLPRLEAPGRDFPLPRAIIYSLPQPLPSPHCVSGTVLVTDETSVSSRDVAPGPRGASLPAEKTDGTVSVISKCIHGLWTLGTSYPQAQPLHTSRNEELIAS